ncbi:uncharacterized protein LOC134254554 isoform X2 [Saccostrea cucullata]|uniref:uncharacterized protein LOC134254554 isoform X2 n=1 Tax=Saccostrea cuccullata TaxID=36930 RepID=UPI002ED6A593
MVHVFIIGITCLMACFSGGFSCDIEMCLRAAGLSVLSIKDNISCAKLAAVYPCILSQKSACAGEITYDAYERYIPDYEARCGPLDFRDVGNSVFPELWILLPVVFKLLAAIDF